MSDQNKLKKIKALFASAVLVLLTIFLFSCNSSGETKEAQDSTGKALGPATAISVPTFTITQRDLADLYDNRGITKLIIELQMNNFSDLSDIDLIVYGARDQMDHGRGIPRLPYIIRERPPTTPPTTVPVTSPLILGNNYVNLQTILVSGGARRDFTHILITPTREGSGQNRTYLVYNIKAIRAEVNRDGKLIKILSEEDLGNSNPSPPADPFP